MCSDEAGLGGGAAVSGADSESRIKVAISNCYNKPSAVIKERRKKNSTKQISALKAGARKEVI